MQSAVQSNGPDRFDRPEAGVALRAWLARPGLARPDSDPFAPIVDAGRIGGFDSARVTQGSRMVNGSARDLRPSTLDDFLVILQVSGRSRLQHAGRVADLNPGDITIIDAAAPCCFEFDRKNIHLYVQLPRATMEQTSLCLDHCLCTTLPRSFSVFLGSLLQSSFQQNLSHDPIRTQAIANALIGLIVAGWSGTGTECAQVAVAETPSLLERVQEYTVANLHSEALTPRAIARVHGISERQLHRLFQGSGTSVCRWIRQCRLDRCASDLRDNRQLSRSITEIAFRWGFNDAAHFSRLFRAEFDESPSDYRASAFTDARVAAAESLT